MPNPPSARPDVCGRVPGREVKAGVTSGVYVQAPGVNQTFGFNITLAVPTVGQQYDLLL